MQMAGENHIEEIRRQLIEAFSDKNLVHGEGEEFVSPEGKYRIKQHLYKQPVVESAKEREERQALERRYNVPVGRCDYRLYSRIEVFDSASNLIASFFIDDADFFHHWILAGEKEYLLFAECLCGGNSVLNLKTREIQGYSDGTDGFMSAGYYPSPDLQHLAILGCYWACPYEVQLFDISNIESLPWPMILETELKGGEGDVVWLDNNTFRISTPPGKTPESSRNVAIPSPHPLATR